MGGLSSGDCPAKSQGTIFLGSILIRGNCPWGSCPGENYSGNYSGVIVRGKQESDGSCPGGISYGAIFRGAFVGGKCPDTLFKHTQIIKPYNKVS